MLLQCQCSRCRAVLYPAVPIRQGETVLCAACAGLLADPPALPTSAAVLEAEVKAWRERFPRYEYRRADDCVALKFEHR